MFIFKTYLIIYYLWLELFIKSAVEIDIYVDIEM